SRASDSGTRVKPTPVAAAAIRSAASSVSAAGISVSPSRSSGPTSSNRLSTCSVPTTTAARSSHSGTRCRASSTSGRRTKHMSTSPDSSTSCCRESGTGTSSSHARRRPDFQRRRKRSGSTPGTKPTRRVVGCMPPAYDPRGPRSRVREVLALARAAAAEALGCADPEDAPLATDDDPDAENPPADDSSETDDGSTPASDLDGPALRDAELRKAQEAEHPRPTTGPEANPYLRPT